MKFLCPNRQPPQALVWFAVGLLGLPAAGVQSASATTHRPIVVGRSTLVSADAVHLPHVESALALNPAQPGQMLAAAMRYDSGVSLSAVYATQDGGETWTPSTTASGIPPLMVADPVVEYDVSGTALFGGIASHPDGFRLWRSVDAGSNWTSVAAVPGGVYDRPYVTVDRGGDGRMPGRLHTGGVVLVHRGAGQASPLIATTYSDDGGRTFAPTILFDPTAAAPGGVGGIADILTTRSGDVTVPFLSGPRIWTITSNDGGRTFSAARPGPLVGRGSGFREMKTLGSRRAIVDTSPTSPFVDRLYISWIDFNDDRYDVKVAHSDDGGETWSLPVRVNDNTGVNDPANPAIAVNRDGVVMLTFNDRRDDPRNECYRLYAAASLDGGDSFLPNVGVHPGVTCTRAAGNWPASLSSRLQRSALTPSTHVVVMSGVPERFPNGGDTQGLVSSPDGRFHAAWINGESGVMQLWYTELRVDLSSAALEPPARDHTADVDLVARRPMTDLQKHVLHFRVALRNRTASDLHGRLVLRLEELNAGFRGLSVLNSDNGRSGSGATWEFLRGASRILKPDAETESRELRFRFDGPVPAELPMTGRFVGRFRVFSAP